MELDAEMQRQIVFSLLAVGFFIVLIVGIGVAFGGESLTPSGGLALVGAMTLFVLVMGAVGIYLDRR